MPWRWHWWRRPSCAGVREARAHQARIQAQQPEVDRLTHALSQRRDANHFREAFENAFRGGQP